MERKVGMICQDLMAEIFRVENRRYLLVYYVTDLLGTSSLQITLMLH